MTLADVLQMGKRRLSEAGVPEPEWNAWYLFSHCFHINRNRYFLCSEEIAAEENIKTFENLLVEREKRIPLEYIIHETEFMGLPFQVNEHVLIPRQDTECLVEEVLKVSEGKDVLDLCTGSGCIGISLAKLGKCKSVTLSDISGEALAVAEKNARKNDVAVRLVESDLFRDIRGSFDIIVSNPPYIRSKEIDELMPEVREHEPRLALDGSEDGLLFYRSIIKVINSFLKPNGWLFFEIGWNQGEEVSRMMREEGFHAVEVKKDLAGLDRIVQGQYRE
ncbi:MAG: peptide chain release factor N(5)-glutamine methyltransferase [Lachnospiraceae bacterium]|nr:peptide chain release factor N(5)-glutamine methyltransferase [Lachnospiraceae bacterium]